MENLLCVCDCPHFAYPERAIAMNYPPITNLCRRRVVSHNVGIYKPETGLASKIGTIVSSLWTKTENALVDC